MRDRNTPSLPVGKLPPELLARLLTAAPVDDPRVLVGPGVGLDCAVIDLGGQLLVCKSDPVTFATDRLGAYLVQINANDLATEGGLAAALWELARASGRGLRFDPAAVPVTPLSARVCAAFSIDPLTAIASGSLLLTAPAPDAARIRAAREREGVPCTEIGEVAAGAAQVVQRVRSGWEPCPLPERDALARVFESVPETQGRETCRTPGTDGGDGRQSNPTDGGVPDGDD